MKRYNTTPISGMQELLPKSQRLFNSLKRTIEQTHERHGFQNIETPTIDRMEILLAKAGGDTEKQIYKVIKTAETADEADQALRFDHTVPLARYVVEHENDLAFPFKVSQIGRNFRGERPQKGRFREFYQCDIDVIGRNNLPIEYDADIITTLSTALSQIISESLEIRLSNRKLLSGVLEEHKITEQSAEIFAIFDHVAKVPLEATRAAIDDLPIPDVAKTLLGQLVVMRGTPSDVLEKLGLLKVSSATFKEGLSELSSVVSFLSDMNAPVEIVIDLGIVRGLDYYTGTVFETFVKNYEQIGSVCSGGRYENLASNFTEHQLPGVGGSIGLSRLFYVLTASGLIDTEGQDATKQPIDLAIIPISPADYAAAYQLMGQLPGLNIDIIFAGKNLGKKLDHASKISNVGVVIGQDEAGAIQNGELDRLEVKYLNTFSDQTKFISLKSYLDKHADA